MARRPHDPSHPTLASNGAPGEDTYKRARPGRVASLDTTDREPRTAMPWIPAEIFDLSRDAILVRDPVTSRILYWNHGAEETYGWTRDEALGRVAHALLETRFPDSPELIDAELAAHGKWEGELAHTRKGGDRVVVESRQVAQRGADGRPVTILEINRNITGRKRAEEELAVRARQQEAVARLGVRALAQPELPILMDEAVRLTAQTLEVEYCTVLELLPEGNAVLLRAGVGWRNGLVGVATVGTGLDSQAGYTLVSSEPVVVEDLQAETRFSGPPLLREHGVVSGMSVIIPGRDRPHGVLDAHSTQRRTFTRDDVHFLQAVANVLATAIERQRLERRLAEDTLRESEARHRAVIDTVFDGIIAIDADGIIRSYNPGAERIFGYTVHEAVGRPLTLLMPAGHRKPHAAGLRRYLEAGKAKVLGRTVEVHGRRKDGSEFPLELTIGEIAGCADVAFTTVLRDITERKRAEAESHLLRAIALAVSGAEDLTAALETALRLVCDTTGWSIGQVWLPSPDGSALECSPAWYSRIERLAGFWAATKGMTFPRGVGLPGRAWSTGRPVWVRDVTRERDFPRASMAAEAGLRAGMAIPVLAGHEVVAVLDFFTMEERPEDAHLIETVSAVAAQLGTLIERRRAEDRLRQSEAILAEAQRIAHVGSWEWDVAADEIRWSDETYRIFGFRPRQFRPNFERFLEVVHPENRDRVVEATRETLREGTPFDVEFRAVRPDGEVRLVQGRGEASFDDDGKPIRMLGTNLDITERRAYEEQLRHQAFHDALTGLPNRALFMDRLEYALLRGIRRHGSVAVLHLDTDRFKFVNDSLGHEAGDQLLVAVGERLRACLRPEDTTARLGGDEFAVLLEDIGGTDEAERVAERIEEALREPFDLAGQEVFITTSIGIAVSAPGRQDPAELLRAADIAMYRAKWAGMGRHEVFDPGMGSRARELLELEADLRRAIDRGELRLHYQPKVELATGRIVGVEALLRWAHPTRGMISPVDFIPLAEETGLIVPIGRWVLEEACRQARVWQERQPSASALDVCVNVSAQQLARPDVVAEVAGVLEKTGLDPASLVLEITESAVMEDAESSAATLHELKDLGVRLAIDDFGTGYSSLSYLNRFCVDFLKIDRSFVDGLGRESEDMAIVRAVIGLAHSLRLEIIAEGVETAEQAEQLRALGCRLAQGYLFSRPLPSEDIDALLTRAVQTRRIGQRQERRTPGALRGGLLALHEATGPRGVVADDRGAGDGADRPQDRQVAAARYEHDDRPERQ